MLEVFLITIALSIDSLIVSIAGGITLRKCRLLHVLKIAIVMAVFQGGLTVVGYFLGISFEKYITTYDHWVAFGILAYLGGKMIREDFAQTEEKTFNLLSNKILIYLAFATSIDALAVGISLAFLERPILWQSLIIGVGTFTAVITGIYLGNHFKKRTNLKLGIIGGIILIGIGIKILVEHLFLT